MYCYNRFFVAHPGSLQWEEGPLSICVDAEPWQLYNGGIITNHCGRQLDHVRSYNFAFVIA
jgi:hypothetical protein